MNPETQRIAIAKACGWHAELGDKDLALHIPDYLNDLNAMHEAWRDYFGFFSEEWVDAHRTLIKVVNQHLDPKSTEDEIYYAAAIANATAAQRAEAFLKALNLWKDE